MLYRREIDGLRAIAVVSVVAYHAKVPGFTGGYLGVDIFFVISGFLICSILLADLARGKFSLIVFYERRARRILPALSFVVALTFPLAWYILQPVKFVEFAESVCSTIIFGANIYFWRTTSYFDDDAENSPLLHTWSLAVEEQFYIIFPLALYILFRYNRARMILLFVTLALISLLIAEVGWRWKPEANFYLPTGRAWELLIGAIVAMLLSGRQIGRSWRGDMLGMGGLVLILWSIFVLDDTIPVPSLYTGVPVLGTALVLVFAVAGSPAARLLSSGPMVGIGLISYSLYLWHQPVLALGRMGAAAGLDRTITSGLLVITLGLAWFSWRFVERPFRRVDIVSRQQMLWFSGISSGGLFAVALSVLLLPEWVHETYLSSLTDESKVRYQIIADAAIDSGFGGGSGCVFWAKPTDTGLPGRAELCAQDGKGILILGDSHANDLFNALATAKLAPFLVSLHQPGCQPHRRLNTRVVEPCDFEVLLQTVVSLKKNFRLILFTEAGGSFYGPGNGPFAPERLHPVLIDEMATYLELLQAASGLPVVVLGPQPSPGFHPSRLNPRSPLASQLEVAVSEEAMAHVDEVDRALAQRLATSSLSFFSKRELADLDLPRDLLIDGKLTYRDGSHWNQHGESIFGERLRKALRDKDIVQE